MRTPNLLALGVAGLVLAGCAAPATEPPAAQPPVEAPTAVTLSTEAAAPTMAPLATEAPAGAAAPQGGTTYSIDPSQSTVTYEVGETLFREGNRVNLAIGTTNAVNGDITLDFQNPANSQVGTLTADISQFKSDKDMRDNRIRENWLESAKFPTVTVVPKSITGIPADVKEGQEISFSMVGDTTIRDATKPLTYAVTAKLENNQLTGTATTEFNMTDFNFQPPDIAGMLKAEDAVKIKIAFVANPK
jgi:polyisoprenoid-binding protein YceI